VTSKNLNRSMMMRQPRGLANADSVGLRLGLWAVLATAAGVGAAYALKKRHNINIFERKFDPDAELAASQIPQTQEQPGR
jgi:hypothetical protein